MKKNILFIVLFWTLSISSVSAGGIRDFCTDSSPLDDHMQAQCLKTQNQAYKELFRLAQKHALLKEGSIEVSPAAGGVETIFHFCMERWELPQYNTYDFAFTVNCIKNQIRTFNKSKK